MKKHALAALSLMTILAFSNCKNGQNQTPSVSTAAPTAATDNTAALAAAKVVYVNIDTLQDRYAWFKQQKTNFEQKQTSLANSLESKAQAFQKEYIALQQKAQTGTVPPAQLDQEGAALQQKQQNIVSERERRTKELMDEMAKVQEELMKKINAALSTLQKEKGFDYVLRHTKDNIAPMLYVNEKLDVTQEVLTLLNAAENK